MFLNLVWSQVSFQDVYELTMSLPERFYPIKCQDALI